MEVIESNDLRIHINNTFITCTIESSTSELVSNDVQYVPFLHLESSTRLILYTLSIAMTIKTTHVCPFLYNLMALSQVICLIPKAMDPNTITDDTIMLWMFCEATPQFDLFVMDGMMLSFNEYRRRVHDFFIHWTFPFGKPITSYHPSTHKFFIILDIDKTIGVTRYDAENSLTFRTDFSIATPHFYHDIMLRNGIYRFLKRMKRIGHVFFCTWGTIAYARAFISGANHINWRKQDTLDTTDVSIPMTNIFSRKNQIDVFPKKIENVLPFTELYGDRPIAIVDDNPLAWDPKDAPYLLQITPMDTASDHPNYLDDIGTTIEMLASAYYL